MILETDAPKQNGKVYLSAEDLIFDMKTETPNVKECNFLLSRSKSCYIQ